MQDIRTRLKVKVEKLLDLENKDELRGFKLNPLSSDELKSIKELF